MIPRGYEDARGETTLLADAVIVGTGPGGAACGRALAERGLHVVFLEEGPRTSRFRPSLASIARHHMQEDGLMVARGDGFIPIAAGRGVGGGSLINSALCFRTPARVLDGWAERLDGDTRYGAAAMSPIYDEIEAIVGVGVSSEEVSGENNRIVARGASALGLHGGLAPRNAPGCVGCALCNVGCPSGGKASVDRNLIPMAMSRGAIVQADTKVHHILVERGRAVGVVGTVHHTDSREPVGRITVRTERVILAAGGVGTPRLLHHTGLAPLLGTAVGRGLHIHPGNAVLGRCDHDVQMWKGATQGAFFEHPDLPGVLPHTFNAPPGAVVVLMGKVGVDAKEALKMLPRICGCVVMVSDTGEGTVGSTSDGRAELRYWFHDEDVVRIKAGMVETARVLMAGGAKELFAPVHGVGWHSTVESFAEALRPRTLADFSLYASHPMASCRMGADPAISVVAADAQAHRLPGLYVADSSVFPTSLGVNPSLTTMALGTAIGRGIP
jgi:choline dehydrogenase-like flavoprotein